MESVNPHSGQRIRSYAAESDEAVSARLQAADNAFRNWRTTSFSERKKLMQAVAGILRGRKAELANLMADEMGKVIRDGLAEVQKCADCCDFYAEHAEKFLQNLP